MQFGTTMLLNLYDCKKDNMRSKEYILGFLYLLLDAIEMHGDNIEMKNYIGRDEYTAGWSLTCMLSSSSLAIHFVPHTGNIYLDITSCKTIPTTKVLDVSNSFWAHTDYNIQVIVRD